MTVSPSSRDVVRRLGSYPRAGLGVFETPLEPWPRLSAAIGHEVWVKRDDVLPLAFGGNKIRKLDLILGEALADGIDVVLTTGGIQSNHCRLTAAAAARLGIACILFLRDEPPVDVKGNVLLDGLFGAQIRYTGNVSYAEVDAEMAMTAEQLRANGRQPLVIPLGGATPLGTAAYAEAVFELAAQCDQHGLEPRSIVVAAGSGSTMTGVWVGSDVALHSAEILGISVSWPAERLTQIATDLGAQTAELLKTRPPDPARLRVSEDYIGPGYTAVTDGALDALRRLASLEGVIVDLTYTAKGLHGLIAEAAAGRLAAPIVFWHTGGSVDVFTRPPSELLGP